MYLQTRKQQSSCFLKESVQCVAAAELWPRLHQLFWDQAHLQQLQSSINVCSESILPQYSFSQLWSSKENSPLWWVLMALFWMRDVCTASLHQLLVGRATRDSIRLTGHSNTWLGSIMSNLLPDFTLVSDISEVKSRQKLPYHSICTNTLNSFRSFQRAQLYKGRSNCFDNWSFQPSSPTFWSNFDLTNNTAVLQTPQKICA